MKETKYFANEFAYNCPYCGHTQGYTDYVEVDEEISCCDECGKDFKVKKI